MRFTHRIVDRLLKELMVDKRLMYIYEFCGRQMQRRVRRQVREANVKIDSIANALVRT